jgi:hypothetical protein
MDNRRILGGDADGDRHDGEHGKYGSGHDGLPMRLRQRERDQFRGMLA